MQPQSSSLSLVGIGFPCIHRGLGLSTSRTFRLRSFSKERLVATLTANIDALRSILRWCGQNGVTSFRIGSGFVPFASHEVMKSLAPWSWTEHFSEELRGIGDLASAQHVRLSMHPDQFVLLNSPRPEVVEASVRELVYHCMLLDSFGPGAEHARVQIHVGGVYGEKPAAMQRFVDEYRKLPQMVRDRLVIENDDRLFSLADCLELHRVTGVPVLLDVFHHACLNASGEQTSRALALAAETWPAGGERPMVDYSEQEPGARRGNHAESLTAAAFRGFLEAVRDSGVSGGFDVMLEIKDKDASALVALEIIASGGVDGGGGGGDGDGETEPAAKKTKRRKK